eukprot:4613388-Pleurochrysis_carterae.AAC.2
MRKPQQRVCETDAIVVLLRRTHCLVDGHERAVTLAKSQMKPCQVETRPLKHRASAVTPQDRAGAAAAANARTAAASDCTWSTRGRRQRGL